MFSTGAGNKGPYGLVVTPDGRKVYVSSDGAPTVSVIDTAADRVVASIEVGATTHGLAVLAVSCKFHGLLGMNDQLLAGDAGPSGAR